MKKMLIISIILSLDLIHGILYCQHLKLGASIDELISQIGKMDGIVDSINYVSNESGMRVASFVGAHNVKMFKHIGHITVFLGSKEEVSDVFWFSFLSKGRFTEFSTLFANEFHLKVIKAKKNGRKIGREWSFLDEDSTFLSFVEKKYPKKKGMYLNGAWCVFGKHTEISGASIVLYPDRRTNVQYGNAIYR